MKKEKETELPPGCKDRDEFEKENRMRCERKKKTSLVELIVHLLLFFFSLFARLNSLHYMEIEMSSRKKKL